MSNQTKDGGDARNTGTSPTTFGRSVESQAQMKDAAALGSADPGDASLHVYRLVPIAARNDPRWGNSPYQGEVVVAARSPGDARIVAASRELDYMEVDAAPADNVTTSNASAFRSDKLYSVIEIDRDRTDLERGVLEGNVSVATIKPTRL
ncbi:hypothetical protein J2Y48_004854 [Mycoplana sp. BE70]|uniref:hypothetical protein n=1 Tax=Mycoplana sp. BE70 TaxID=2817775 RepID=UPI0028541EF2|nr:hypothetical protein [Mycoplana sp. BE70]MDR6759538.1 hypothetical protein [Mycoplana sp. BE70]